MSVSKLPKDWKKLVRSHSTAIKKLQEADLQIQAVHEKILEAVQAMVRSSLLELLKTIPSEEVNREKRGIRVAALKESGYETMLDLYEASEQSLADIGGISESGAREIKQITKAIAAEAEKSLKIRLSADDRTPDATALVAALSQFAMLQETAAQCSRLLADYEAPVKKAISDLSPASNFLKWLFASEEQKLLAHEGYKTLKDADYASSIPSITSKIQNARFVSPQSAWRTFTEDPIPLFTILEDAVPGILGNDDQMYGLPQTLAQEIQQEPFYPEGLRCQLRRYQEWGVKYILHQKRVLLGDEMGLGKTVQAIAAMVSLRNTGATHFLVVCPASVIENWCREIRKHSDLSAIKVHGDHREEALTKWRREGGVAVTNFETTKIFQLEPEFQFTLAIVDEAHYIKNPGAQRSRNVKDICTHAERILFMTGTALENQVEEMVTLMDMLQPEVASAAGRMTSLSSAPQFRELVSPVYYRRRRDSVLTELPDLIDTPQWCELTAEEERLYEAAILSDHYAQARRVSWNMPDIRTSSKAARMLEIMEDAREDGRKIIVFSFFLDTIQKIYSLLPDRCMQPINGSVPVPRRQEIIDEFNAAPAGSVLLAQIQAGGTGLNIQSASVVILCEPQFKPSLENQAISRAYRMGQTRNVLVYRLLCEDTVDEKIMEMLSAKQAEFDAFADKSAVGEESLQLDQKTFETIMQEEQQRILAKQAQLPAPDNL